MAIEFEPTVLVSKCGRFVIYACKNKYFSIDLVDKTDSDFFPTFADAVAWCESRAKQQGQGGGE